MYSAKYRTKQSQKFTFFVKESQIWIKFLSKKALVKFETQFNNLTNFYEHKTPILVICLQNFFLVIARIVNVYK